MSEGAPPTLPSGLDGLTASGGSVAFRQAGRRHHPSSSLSLRAEGRLFSHSPSGLNNCCFSLTTHYEPLTTWVAGEARPVIFVIFVVSAVHPGQSTRTTYSSGMHPGLRP